MMMMMTDVGFLGAARLMNAGPLQPLIDAFVAGLQSQRHTSLTISNYEHSARHFADWLCRSNVALGLVDEDVVRRFARHRCRCPGTRRQDHVSAKYVRRVQRFIRFLADREVLPAVTPPVLKRGDARIAAYQDWLRHHRGISERTIDRHGRMITRLLPALGADPELYDALLIRRVIIDEAARSSRPHVKTMTTALRGYLRFLAATGLSRCSLDHAVPTIPQWRLSALPRYLPAGAVEQVIASCDLTKPQGIRDRAILLLLARLGLRAGDVLMIRLGDIAWNEGTIRVRGKSRREIRLPLPQDVGDALLDYLTRGRSSADEDRVFLRCYAPYRPFKGSSVISSIVRLALNRAGIVDAPSRGANLLRHSAATSMLRAGATLDAVGTLLRHRSIDTTAHYAKVDVTMLQLIAQPWPGEAPC
jgi:integrase/recombinase XerD